MMSTELAFTDFLNRVKPWRVESERAPMPARAAADARYDFETWALTLAMRSGDPVRLEAALFGSGLASTSRLLGEVA